MIRRNENSEMQLGEMRQHRGEAAVSAAPPRKLTQNTAVSVEVILCTCLDEI